MERPRFLLFGNVDNSNMDFKRAASIQHMEPVKPICLEPVETQIKQVEINPSFPASFEDIQITTPIPIQPSLIQEPEFKPNPIQEVNIEIQENNSQTETGSSSSSYKRDAG